MQRRTGYEKSNSHTQIIARGYVDAVTQICNASGITKGVWDAIMFEIGCQWVEINKPDHAKALLQDVENGFWAWWIEQYINDDITLLECTDSYLQVNYERHKYEMITLLKEVRREKTKH